MMEMRVLVSVVLVMVALYVGVGYADGVGKGGKGGEGGGGGEGSDFLCGACVEVWGDLRKFGGCGVTNGTGEFCSLCPVSICGDPAECQKVVNEVCAAGCEDSPSECSILACEHILHLCPINGTLVVQ